MATEAAQNTDVQRFCINCGPTGGPVAYSQYQAFGSAVLYSARATIDAFAFGEHGQGDQEVSRSDFALQQFTNPTHYHFQEKVQPEEGEEAKESTRGLQVRRLIGTDKQLAECLSRELALRGAWPTEARSQGHIVVITERGTAYGRSLPRVLENQLRQSIGIVQDSRIHEDLPIKTFRYLRGIDGRKSNEEMKSELPAGASQVDYLRRLTQQLLDYQTKLRSKSSTNISAIGVLGSDPYDKLLLFRALRKHFPSSVFFTTDLDERMCMPSELPYTQNAVVATHFGMSLDDTLQGDVPAFRGSYQTAAYFSTLFALRQKHLTKTTAMDPLFSSDDPWGISYSDQESKHTLHPLIFEIGRRRPYQVTSTGTDIPSGSVSPSKHPASAQALIQPRSPKEEEISIILKRIMLVLGACFLLFALLAIYLTAVQRFASTTLSAYRNVISGRRRRTRDIAISALTICMVVLGVFIVYDHCREDGEPFSILEGVSVWPAVIIRGIALTLTVSFLINARDNTWHGLDDISRVMLGNRPFSKRMKGIYWSLAYWWDSLRTNRHNFNALLHQSLISTWHRPSKASISSAPRNGANQLLTEYRNRESLVPKLVRVIPSTCLFFLFGSLVFWVANYPDLPARGFPSRAISKILLFTSIFAMVYLVFTILDSSKLAARFIRKLVFDPIEWPAKVLDAAARERGLPSITGMKELLTTRAIAMRTKQVGKLVIYPFTIVVLVFIARKAPLDNYDYPITLAFVLLVTLVWVALSSLALRREAVSAKQIMLSRLESMISGSMNGESEKHTKQLQLVIDEVRRERRGAFAPVVEDPIFKAIAIPFSSIGGLSLLENILRNS